MRRATRPWLGALLVGLALALPFDEAVAQVPADLDGYVARTLATFGVPGAAIAIVEHDPRRRAATTAGGWGRDANRRASRRSDIDNEAAAGSINASAADMTRWLAVQLGQGAMPDGRRRPRPRPFSGLPGRR